MHAYYIEIDMDRMKMSKNFIVGHIVNTAHIDSTQYSCKWKLIELYDTGNVEPIYNRGVPWYNVQ